ncbi:HTH-type transcriptional regulator KipR [Pigmentiphaga humi]|uniref:HTH-type transcriptional regulator KipR n=1 Tax=Pigmentiphaga humi TaxID=2478468 RepID=A0A3P4B2A5_9BURK|nr:helix-turn-helix domain-containing protein [Pigmentiphaga humi]VCU69768.1 HTH-type transcriptional regulator KipR [Pigmentiphaga humi]
MSPAPAADADDAAGRDGSGEGGSSLERMLRLLDAYTHERHAWNVDDLAAHFGFTPSSTYRYVKELCKAGLLVRLPRGVYAVGARVVELEALIRETDPVIRVGKPMLRGLAEETGCHVLLSNVYGDHLLNVLVEPGIEPLELTYLRGKSLPWFRGAPSFSVLAFWPRARVRKLFDQTFPSGGADWDDCWSQLRAVRKAGYCVSHEGLDPDVVGYGAPVMLEDEVIGTISLVCSKRRSDFLNGAALGAALQQTSRALGDRLLQEA